MELEQWQEALKDFGKALMIEPGSPLFLERRAIVRTYLHDFRGAMSDINEANSLAPGDKRILDNRDWIIRYRNQVLPDVSSRSKTE